MCILAVIAAFLLLSPRFLMKAVDTPSPLTIFHVPKKQAVRTITLYHIASARTYQGSVTVFLQDRAEAFEKKNRGVYIAVEGMTQKTFAERLENGRIPDAYSFFSGDLYPELLQPLPETEAAFLSGLCRNPYAAPYLFSGYAVCRNGDSTATLQDSAKAGSLAASPLHAARLSVCGQLREVSDFKSGACACAVLDLRAVGDVLRNDTLVNVAAEALDPFTDQVCYFGIAKDTDETAAAWLQAFLTYLLSDEVQNGLSMLGAFPVSETAEPVYAQRLLSDVFARYREGVVTPDPFLWYSHREQLETDAVSAVAGDAYAQKRFFDRWAVVFGG